MDFVRKYGNYILGVLCVIFSGYNLYIGGSKVSSVLFLCLGVVNVANGVARNKKDRK